MAIIILTKYEISDVQWKQHKAYYSKFLISISAWSANINSLMRTPLHSTHSDYFKVVTIQIKPKNLENY